MAKKSLATSQARFHSTEPDPNLPQLLTSWLLRSTKLALCIEAFTTVPIDSLTLSLQPQIYRCSDRVMYSKADYSFLGHDAV